MAAQVGQRVFGAGRMWGINNTLYSTPTPALVPQDMTFTLKRDVKSLFGYQQLPVDVGAGELSVNGKVTYGSLSARLLNDMMIGGTLSTGQITAAFSEAISLTTGSTQAAPANLAGLTVDLGIVATTLGVPFVKQSTATVLTTGQYSLSTLGYALSSLEAITGLTANYLYSTSGGQTVAMTNQNMGKIGGFQAVMAWVWGTEKATIALNNCLMTGMEFATKNSDFQKPTADWMAAADANNTLGNMSFAELT